TAAKIEKKGTAKMATALAIGGECGIVLTVPGVGALALAGLLGVPLGKMLLFGLVLVIPTVAIAVAVMCFLFDRGWWDEERDEQQSAVEPVSGGNPEPESAPAAVATRPAAEARTETPLPLLFTPLCTALVLIAVGAILDVAEVHIPVIEFLSTPVVAL